MDPTQRIISTEQVLPQNVVLHDQTLYSKLGHDLPVEVSELILGQIGYRMTLAEAKYHRSRLMQERSLARDVVTERIHERPFNLCEH